MKKFLVFGLIAGAGALMAGCSKDEAKSDFGQNAIEFGTYLGRDAQTRGAITTSESIKTSGFGVTAFYTGQNEWTAASADNTPNFMYNQQVTYTTSTTGGAWSYSPVKYWPTMKSDKISFFAYAPYNAAGIELAENNATSANTSLTFTVQDNAADMVDFVAAQVIDAQQKDAAQGGQDAVTFNLKHELSRLAFKVRTSEDMAAESHVVLKKVELDENASFYKSATYTFGNANGEAGKWSNPSALTTSFDIKGALDFGEVTVGNYTSSSAFDITSSTAEPLFKDGGYLFVIPVEGGLADAKKASVTFEYDIVTIDANLNGGYSCTSATKTVYLPNDLLQQGKAYNVTFTFNMDQIEVAASVDGWDVDAIDKPVEVPFTPDDATK